MVFQNAFTETLPTPEILNLDHTNLLHRRNLRELRLFWLGKLLISNPWCFEFCHDRQEQRVDALFAEGQLDQLVELDLSGFFQTVVDKTIQVLCTQHLSSESVTSKHLEKVSHHNRTKAKM